jgi:hypothetical protein
MKVGDLVTLNRSHMEKTNIFYDSWLQLGLILELNSHLGNHDNAIATVVWWKNGKTHETCTYPVSKLEVLSESIPG